jgi:hypothetical protein
VWTPKRIILLVGGAGAFLVIYFVYSLTSLGRINTLPPLPEQYKVSRKGMPSGERTSKKPSGLTPLQKKLTAAFNPGCKELEWPFQLEMNAKNMVLAAINFKVVEDGRVKFSPMSLAIFGKNKDGRGVEINTLKCDEAYIRFDRRLSSLNPSEMNGRKIVEVQLIGNSPAGNPIRIVNNRRTASDEDDLVVTINTGPVYYIEKTQLIRTSDFVHIRDGKYLSRDGQRLVPPKADIYAKGMEMELTTASPPPRPGVFVAPKQKNESITGVKRIVLKENVIMNLCVNKGGGPFPGEEPSPKRAKTAGSEKNAAPEEPSRIRIDSPGRFEYRLFKDHDEASFDAPTETDMSTSPQDVMVQRINDEKIGYDMLVCKHLEMRIRRRNGDKADPKSPPSDGEQGFEIETVHATGPFVTLTSDAEKLNAHGNDFFHDTSKKLTILKGVPNMEANKEDNLIVAPMLTIQEIPLADASNKKGLASKDNKKSYQYVEASGPGSIDMMNKSTKERTTHAYWKERLISTRDGALDLLVLKGAARFKDDEHDQALQAEELRVWLLPDEQKPTVQAVAISDAKSGPRPSATEKKDTEKGTASAPSSRRPHHIEALRNVFAHSKDMNVHDAARLVVLFTDVPEALMPPSKDGDKPKTKSPPAVNPIAPLVPIANPQAAGVQPPSGVAAMPYPAGGTKTQTTNSAKPLQAETEPNPIDLSARNIETKVLRCGERMALDHLWAEGGAAEYLHKRGGVRVRQKSNKAGEDGVDIEANTLDMTCTVNGNILVASGDLANLEMGKIKIIGPVVNVDQVSNKVWVEGAGAMCLQSNTTLENKPLEKPVPLTIHWNDDMVFQGSHASFRGGIQADQNEARLACQRLQVIFDRPISLKQGMRNDRPAKVKKLVADDEVRAEDQTIVSGKLDKYQRLSGVSMTVESETSDEPSGSDDKATDSNTIVLSGPGSVRILQRGSGELTAAPGKPTASRPPPASLGDDSQEMKLTEVRFENLMKANNRTNVATFWGSVRLLNMPGDDPRREVDFRDILSKELPKGVLYLNCNQLTVRTYRVPIKEEMNQDITDKNKRQIKYRTYQEMVATGQVVVQSQEFTAKCDRMIFNEEKDQIIFHGENGNEAVLSKVTVKGGRPLVFQSNKLIYRRSTGAVDGNKINSIRG